MNACDKTLGIMSQEGKANQNRNGASLQTAVRMDKMKNTDNTKC